MSNKNNNSDSLFSNQDTIVRRDWISSALESVRSHLQSGPESDPMAGPIDSAYIDANDDERPAETTGQANAAADGSTQRGLYVAWSAQERRSGT